MNPSTPRNPDALTVARAILSTLDAPSAVFALVTVATFARAIVAAAAVLRQCAGDAAEATARAMCSGAEEAFAAHGAGVDPSTRTYELAACWWFAAPYEVMAAFWRGDESRTTVEAQARAALVEVEALRLELALVDAVRAMDAARAVMLCAGGHQVAVKALRDAATAPIGDDENPF